MYNWLILHNTIKGLDLRKNPPLGLAKALFIGALTSDEGVKPDDLDKWVAWIGAFEG